MSALGPDASGRWLPLPEAARELKTTTDALRKRIARETIGSRKGNEGAVHVLVTEADTAGLRPDPDRTAAALEEARAQGRAEGELEALRRQVAGLERQALADRRALARMAREMLRMTRLVQEAAREAGRRPRPP